MIQVIKAYVAVINLIFEANICTILISFGIVDILKLILLVKITDWSNSKCSNAVLFLNQNLDVIFNHINQNLYRVIPF